MKNNTNTFENIPSTGFTSTNVETKSEYVRVENNVSDDIKLSTFSILQLIEGANASAKDKRTVDAVDVQVMSKLFTYAVSTGFNGAHQDTTIHVTRNEVKIMKKFIEARMSHCEQERDNRNDKFNPDTYIGQKLLLIELREWLLGSYTETEPLYNTISLRKDKPSLKDHPSIDPSEF
jgi:hypothetical protein